MIADTLFSVHHRFVTSGPKAMPTPYNVAGVQSQFSKGSGPREHRDEARNIGVGIVGRPRESENHWNWKEATYPSTWSPPRSILRVCPQKLDDRQFFFPFTRK